ncbi:hypothetical protein CLV30_11759 [Haloactinopolyspora alba]|uniref:Uncharacterized protein n=1 Tax=Haloactinopolyspora alba TaxID=648780 RepID=A0A2P8DRB3_9ACTN|nr:hypothetical protein [Haloactinopolyspora alba]PSK99756.1 hypothetical protein CLV30_11759 [Haloactinopolyspora alba]
MTTVEFATRLLELGRARGPVPRYGSSEWEALGPTDPRRFAAVVAAAECWRRDSEPEAIAARLRAELAEADLYVRYRLAEASRDVAGAYSELVDERGQVVSYAELVRRRADLLGVAS